MNHASRRPGSGPRPATRALRSDLRRLALTLLGLGGWSLLASAGLALAAGSALADTAVSSNWSGYAVHRSGVHFRSISARWRQPHATCSAQDPTYSASWVGIGGYARSAPGLEQIGTELDCHNGAPVSTAWYEILPAASTPIHMTVRQGDLMSATVKVAGHQVTFVLRDLSTHHGFRLSNHAATVDISSAEWILEAPSVCQNKGCVTLPLADFGNVDFNRAAVTSVSGHRGAITNRGWTATKIKLMPSGPHFVFAGGTGEAIPSVLSAAGSAFSVAYRATKASQLQSFARTATVESTRASPARWVPIARLHHMLMHR
jgi:hypothetical protein